MGIWAMTWIACRKGSVFPDGIDAGVHNITGELKSCCSVEFNFSDDNE